MAVLLEVAGYIPPGRIPISEIGERSGISPSDLMVFRHFFGLDTVSVAPDTDLPGLLTAAARRLTQLADNAGQVRYLLHARTSAIPDGTSSPLDQIRADLHLHNARTLALNHHACASGLLALDHAAELLAADPDPCALALVLVGDKLDEVGMHMLPGITFLGEAAAACLMRQGGDGDRLLARATRILDGEAELFTRSPEECLDTLADVILAALDDARTDLADLALVLPHNVNRISWVRLCERIGYPIDRVYLDNVAVTGHCFGADPLLNYCGARDRQLLRPGERYAMVSVGWDTTFTALILECQS
ncbi:3-oxoacyl-[acyl-carrier-protein] synthase III C-terminal domain-containing protein [Streptomyces virginiae]|uniref:3-oxoacyl-[acyl-carrier-protein] synthase III C-terminal domain-containing protein n=1 Tax=Streptomyces virginiae TaxID=1961 RepID=UPI003686154A